MTLHRLRELCLSFPGTTEQIQWGADLVFKVGGKMFCVACTEVAPNVMSFKCDPERFAELCEREGIIPAPYLARAQWIALERWDTLDDRELKPLIGQAYALIKQKLPKKTRERIDETSRRVRRSGEPTRRSGGSTGRSGGSTRRSGDRESARKGRRTKLEG